MGPFITLSYFSWICINISNVPNGARYFGILLILTGSFASFPGVVTWLGNNLVGQYKRAVGMALHMGIGNFSGVIASSIYRSQDAPRFVLEHGLELMLVVIGLIDVPVLVISYWWINRRRDEAARQRIERGEKLTLTVQELTDLADRPSDLRYTL